MKNNKSTKKTTIRSLTTDMNRWYGPHWWFSGLAMLGIFLSSVVLPGILG